MRFKQGIAKLIIEGLADRNDLHEEQEAEIEETRAQAARNNDNSAVEVTLHSQPSAEDSTYLSMLLLFAPAS